MATVTVGNAHVGTECLVLNEFDDDDGEPFEIYLEYVTETEFIGYKHTLESGSSGKSVTVSIYLRSPTSDDYEDYIGVIEGRFVPCVFLFSGNRIASLLNSSVELVESPLGYTGWFSRTVTLSRELQKSETVWAGFLTDWANPVWDRSFSGRGSPTLPIFSYNGSIAHYKMRIEDGTLFNYSQSFYSENYSCYWQYTEKPSSVAYSRGVSSAASAFSSSGRRFSGKRFFSQVVSASGGAGRSVGRIRSCSLSFGVSDVESRFARFFSAPRSSGIFSSGLSLNRAVNRCVFDEKRLVDFSERFAGFFALFSPVVGTSEVLERKSKTKREIGSVSGFGEIVSRSSVLCRAAGSVGGFVSSVFSGRIMYRTVAAALSLWDFLRGKIREENCVVELFTPVCDELIVNSE